MFLHFKMMEKLHLKNCMEIDRYNCCCFLFSLCRSKELISTKKREAHVDNERKHFISSIEITLKPFYYTAPCGSDGNKCPGEEPVENAIPAHEMSMNKSSVQPANFAMEAPCQKWVTEMGQGKDKDKSDTKGQGYDASGSKDSAHNSSGSQRTATRPCVLNSCLGGICNGGSDGDGNEPGSSNTSMPKGHYEESLVPQVKQGKI